MTRIGRMFTDLPIRGNPSHPCHPWPRLYPDL